MPDPASVTILKDWLAASKPRLRRKAIGVQMPTSPRDQEDMPGAPGEISRADMWERAKAAVAGNGVKPMPLYRRRESITADEVIKKLTDGRYEYTAELVFAVGLIERAIAEICGKNGIENDATRR